MEDVRVRMRSGEQASGTERSPTVEHFPPVCSLVVSQVEDVGTKGDLVASMASFLQVRSLWSVR